MNPLPIRIAKRNTPFYNVQHSPIGAFASFTLGYPGAKGGFGLELGRPANESVYIGLQSRDGQRFQALPFFEGSDDPTRRFDQNAKDKKSARLESFPEKSISRELRLASDSWKAGDLTFTIYTQYRGVPDPEQAKAKDLREALIPAVWAEATVDNRQGKKPRLFFFGYQGGDPYSSMHCFESSDSLTGIGQGTRTALVSLDAMQTHQAFAIERILKPAADDLRPFGLGGVAALSASVPAGTSKTFRFALCFYRDGNPTSGLISRYFYHQFFRNIEDVAEIALSMFPRVKASVQKADAMLNSSKLSKDQQWQLAHSVHSYYGSTQFLESKGTPFWIVNEGEYRMLNTFDLTADQVFFELEMNPWTVRNELDWFVNRYAYTDKVRFPGQSREYPGGISFTHDMGIANAVSAPGRSAYEKDGIHGCFSHMTHEELVNWVLCALLYVKKTGDRSWLKKNLNIFVKCFLSMQNRDHPEDSKRNGIMGLDSSRCEGGSEITTYDSLDASLGQARNNLYLAVKCWACYTCMEALFLKNGRKKEAGRSRLQAERAASTIAQALNLQGFIPAVLGEGVDSRIIPAIEGLVFPYLLGLKADLRENGPYENFIRALKKHLQTVMKPGTCLFADGGFKLSSSSNNSWLSKVYLCQFVMRQVLGIKKGIPYAKSDAAHVLWLLHPVESYWAWSDQMISGVACGSKYYPRGVTSILWLQEK